MESHILHQRTLNADPQPGQLNGNEMEELNVEGPKPVGNVAVSRQNETCGDVDVAAALQV